MEYIIDALGMGWWYLFENPITFLYIIGGVFLGLVFGAIPGLTATLGVVLILPFTYILAPEDGMALLLAIYVGGIAGGLIASVLLNIPGSPAAMVTCFDGSPMARNGRPADALYLGTFSSAVGGILSAIVLVLLASQLAKIALKFGAWEYFGLGIFGVCIVVKLCADDYIKGFLGIIIGMTIAMVGMDPVLMNNRFTYGVWQLEGGFPQVATLMGLFALTEIYTQVNKMFAKEKIHTIPVQKVGFLPSKGLLGKPGMLKNILRSAAIGTGIGILPGVGQTTSSLLAYNAAKGSDPHPEKYGTGCEEGIVSSETANNACCGGALIPMLSLGIPGDTVTAVLLGGLMIHGMTPGPLLFRDHQHIIGAIYIVFILSNIIMFLMEIGLIRVFIRVLSSPVNILFPAILAMCTLGSFAANNKIFDCWIFLFIGVIGFLLLNSGFSLPPIILGFILGPIIEDSWRVAMISSRGDIFSIATHPIAYGLLIVSAVVLLWPVFMRSLKNSRLQSA
ncbi:conserved membrane hypothetical protein [uncultured delta proteobacterium]|uniref:DUF112 domain-containing protein n=1 Tax=uncultured delta proteobacterium TaxID=34034 RepID=A0A212KA05_9DELT|nr:conserved membrane hypothetical protein [uncultured delta proteobacterium]